jgi:hypothetical protein
MKSSKVFTLLSSYDGKEDISTVSVLYAKVFHAFNQTWIIHRPIDFAEHHSPAVGWKVSHVSGLGFTLRVATIKEAEADFYKRVEEKHLTEQVIFDAVKLGIRRIVYGEEKRMLTTGQVIECCKCGASAQYSEHVTVKPNGMAESVAFYYYCKEHAPASARWIK